MRAEFSALQHQKVIHQTPVLAQSGGQWSHPILASLNWAGADSKFLETTKAPHYLSDPNIRGVICGGG